ncbi:LLM class flavin-dependent oxidoreductase [Pseudomonas sp. NPDC086251]|uniref:LLM class flavin-dependent oxidoreductase n=1 Tax=Pseudomonas sp. NPDC086251 TaxID=3364431 RepID=UPI00383367C7
MKLAMFMQPLHRTGLSYHEMYNQDLAGAVHADAVGFDELWVGEHTTQRTEPITNALQFLSALIPLTKHMKLCPGVLNLPQHSPARVAADIAMFDHMSKGRFLMGIGPGGLSSDIEVYGTDRKLGAEVMLSCYEMIRAIWATQPPYNLATDYHKVSIQHTVNHELQLGYMPVPYQNPFPRVATSAMSHASSTAKLAGAKDWDLMSAYFCTRDAVVSQWQAYVQGAERAGIKPDARNWKVGRSVFVADSQAQAEDYMADASNSIRYCFEFMVKNLSSIGLISAFKTRPDMLDAEVTIEHCIREMVIYGDVNSVTEQLVALSEQTGPFGTLMTTFHEWDNETLWKRSMELTAKNVMPRLSDHMGPLLDAQ